MCVFNFDKMGNCVFDYERVLNVDFLFDFST
jgi:hypothetical protein